MANLGNTSMFETQQYIIVKQLLTNVKKSSSDPVVRKAIDAALAVLEMAAKVEPPA